MTESVTVKRWSAEYATQRASGAPGWGGADSYRLKEARITEALAEHPAPPSATFLELGCGAGNLALWMASRGFASFGVDVAPEAIRWARDKAAAAGLPARFVVAELAAMPLFQDGQFDIVFDADCFHMITGDDRDACFREVCRVLKLGGLLIAGGNVRDDAITDPAAKRLLTPDGFLYAILSETELCGELTGAGFTILDVKHHPKRGSNRQIKENIAIHATR
jgi:ubiquinone/menaquinone biosynthesis C-methylase UbiE